MGFAIMGFAPMPMFSTYGILTALMIFLALVAALFFPLGGGAQEVPDSLDGELLEYLPNVCEDLDPLAGVVLSYTG